MTPAFESRPDALLAAAGGAAGNATGSHTFGLISIGQTQLGLPLAALREVVPSPAQFNGLPVAAKGLVGALALRGQVVPVLDLRLVLDQAAPSSSEQVVVLLRHGGCVLGLLADRVDGLVDCAPGSLQAMGLESGGAGRGADPGLLFKGSFERADVGGVVSVLDVAALMRLPGLPLLRAAPPGTQVSTLAAAAAEQRSLMLVRCGELGLAIDASGVHATLPRLTVQASALQSASCRGVIEHAGLRIPTADPLALLELGELPRGESCEALLLRFEQGFVALLVSRVVDIVRVPVTALQPLSPLAVRRPDLLHSTVTVAGRGDHLVPGPLALRQHPELLTLASMNVRIGAPKNATATQGEAAVAGSRGATERRGDSVITYDIFGEAATRLEQVCEVLRLQGVVMRPARAHPALIGLLSHRGRTVTLVCLATLLGRSAPDDAPEPCVLMVELQGASVGFVVRRLCGIDTTVWEQAPTPDSAATGQPRSARGLGAHVVVELGADAKRRTVRLIDLHAQVLALMALARTASLVEAVSVPQALISQATRPMTAQAT